MALKSANRGEAVPDQEVLDGLDSGPGSASSGSALGMGAADPSFRSPMAVAVIGGLVTSTLLSLLVVPALYTLIDDLEHWLGRHLKRHRPEPLPEAGA